MREWQAFPCSIMKEQRAEVLSIPIPFYEVVVGDGTYIEHQVGNHVLLNSHLFDCCFLFVVCSCRWMELG